MQPTDILDFWYSDRIRNHWFASTPELDAEIRAGFEALWEAAAAGDLDAWRETPEGALALAIVLDQFPLNMFRGDARSFATEGKAIAVALRAIDNGLHAALPVERLAFLFMPLMHSERLEHQDLSVKLFEAHGLTDNLKFARHHRGLIERFGRFPHRNAILGRESTAAELEYLASDHAFKGDGGNKSQ
ncbi:MAG: DUF924 domain-containing protein [Gammaproteobacteria bacterium]|nr:DUF924 domain-containing protein [Gammaproteobacteria bacterium]